MILNKFSETKSYLASISGDYNELIESLQKELIENYSSMIYITMNKTSSTILKKMKQYNVDLNKIAFIDGITKLAFPVEDKSSIRYVHPEDMVKKGYDKINEYIKNRSINWIVFDSLTTLLIYFKEDISDFIKFIQKIIILGEENNIVCLFTCLEKDKQALSLDVFKWKVIDLN